MLEEILLGFILLSLYCLWFSVNRNHARKKQNEPPGLPELPIIGSAIPMLMTVGLGGQQCEGLARVSEKYGHTVLIKIGDFTTMLTDDYETAKQVLNSSDWAGRFPDKPRFKEHTLYKNLGLMWGHSEQHRLMRKFTIRTFKSLGFGELKQTEAFLQEELHDFIGLMNERLTRSTGKELYLQHTFKIPTFNIIWRVMSGERFSYDDQKIKKLIHAVDDCAKITVGMDPEWFFPILRYIPGCSPSRAKRESFVICHEFFIDIMNERRKLGRYKELQTDYIDHLLKVIDEGKEKEPEIYCDEQFHVTCVDLLFGGLDTTSNSLEFAILYLILNPEVQKKVQAEIDAVVGEDRFPSFTDRSNLKYCEATMLETLRWANIVPIIARTASCDTVVGPYNVKKDIVCGINATMLHKNKDIWGDPEVFRPERFLDEHNNIVNSEKLFVFGGGLRHCLGYTHAKTIWLAFLTTALQHFTFEPSPLHPDLSVIPDSGITNAVKPFYAIVKPRLGK